MGLTQSPRNQNGGFDRIHCRALNRLRGVCRLAESVTAPSPEPPESLGLTRIRRMSLAILVLLLGLGIGFQSACATPSRIILLRHGEKPADDANYRLSREGKQRALALGQWLSTNSEWTAGQRVAGLFATRVTPHDHSHRTGETLAPLAKALHLPIEMPYASKDYAAFSRGLLRDRRWTGKVVVVCWTHHNIADLAAALGVKPAPAPWKEKTFDRFWIIDFQPGRPTFHDLPQRLLPGDSPR